MISPDIQDNVQPENYAKALMINSFGLAIAFAFIYVLLLGVFVFKAVRNSTYVLWVTAFFCQGLLELLEPACHQDIDAVRITQCESCRLRCGRRWRKVNLLARISTLC